MPTYPPVSSLKVSGAFTMEEALDVLAYILQTSSMTTGTNTVTTAQVEWIVGDVNMGQPGPLPFGYIQPFNESVIWETAQGGRGGLAAGGNRGLDNWQMQILLTVIFAKHDYIPPKISTPPAGSPVSTAALGIQPPFFEQPSYRMTMQMVETIKAVLRTNITIAGEVATTRVTESRYLLQNIEGALYRAARISLSVQQRRPRGN